MDRGLQMCKTDGREFLDLFYFIFNLDVLFLISNPSHFATISVIFSKLAGSMNDESQALGAHLTQETHHRLKMESGGSAEGSVRDIWQNTGSFCPFRASRPWNFFGWRALSYLFLCLDPA